MKLPEVIGFIHKNKSVKIGKGSYCFYPVEYVALELGASIEEINSISNKYNMKT